MHGGSFYKFKEICVRWINRLIRGTQDNRLISIKQDFAIGRRQSRYEVSREAGRFAQPHSARAILVLALHESAKIDQFRSPSRRVLEMTSVASLTPFKIIMKNDKKKQKIFYNEE